MSQTFPGGVADSPPLGVYVHWPFCNSKCPYCDFNSRVEGNVDHDLWTRALLQDVQNQVALMGDAPRTLGSIFFGGGTPSLMEPDTVEALVGKLTTLWPVHPALEITLETNPATVSRDKLDAFRKAGVNRLSIGLQSLNEADLKTLGRRHTVPQALDCLGMARALFPRVSVDMIYARPHQTLSAWEAELGALLDLQPSHVSLYQLTVEENTPLFRDMLQGRCTLPDEDVAADLYQMTHTLLQEHGLAAYEVSNHARAGEESRHNLAIWRGGEYLGTGPRAHGRLRGKDDKTHATVGIPAPAIWLDQITSGQSGLKECSALENRERAVEIVMTGLRLQEGVSERRLFTLTGLDFSDILDTESLAMAVESGLVGLDHDRLYVQPSGTLFLNTLTSQLIAF